ncbi:hypothetical protein WR25_24450 isoform B [Diploscapter pachys]|uniref:long-chain-fatty-acid--CoA ligase n=1 Tax=Diploscapter pachys TaxID=2018661 RepID=A0A2A2LJC3_9BILA|nr:hypothetical protein WR25_24450 isoform A [Diploscapter pachys]PAV86148.1 hypothetical protein WR25_24450 isoform B [Diploscapter pachys]
MKAEAFQTMEEPFLHMVKEILQDRFNEKAETLFRKFFQFCLKYLLEGFNGIHSLNYMVAMHAMIRSSLVIVPLYHNSKIETLCDIIENCNLELVFCDDEIRANCFIEKKNEGFLGCLKRLVLLKGNPQKCYNIHNPDGLHVTTYEDMLILGRGHQHALIPPEPEDVYIICHTSGTTGQPKGVQLTHRALLAAMAGIYTTWVPPPNSWPFGKEDTYFSFLSLAHIYEHLIQTLTMYFGGRIGIYRGDITKLIQDIQALQPTILSLVPRLLNKFYEHIHTEMGKKNIIIRKIFEKAKKEKINLLRHGIQRYDTIWDKLVFRKLHYLFGGKLRVITTGGAAVNKDVKDFTRIAYGCPLVEGYGQTECAACGTISLPFDTSYGNVGGPAPWAQVKLVDVPELGYFSVEDKGEVCFRGAALMNGYFNEDDLNRKTIDEEGWLHTGDIGQWRGDGRLEIVDRKNALFKLAQGDFVSPESIETTYLNNPLITQIFVTGDTCRSFLVAICVVHYQALKASFINAYPNLKVSQDNISTDAFLNDEKVIRHLINELNQTGRAHGLQTIELIQEAYLTTAKNHLATATTLPFATTLAIFRLKRLEKVEIERRMRNEKNESQS